MVGITGSMNFYCKQIPDDFCLVREILVSIQSGQILILHQPEINHFGDSSFLVKFSPSDILGFIGNKSSCLLLRAPSVCLSFSIFGLQRLGMSNGQETWSLKLWKPQVCHVFSKCLTIEFDPKCCQRGSLNFGTQISNHLGLVGRLPATNRQEKHPTAFPVSPHYVSTSFFWPNLSHWNPSYHYIPSMISMIGLYQNRVSTTWCPS